MVGTTMSAKERGAMRAMQLPLRHRACRSELSARQMCNTRLSCIDITSFVSGAGLASASRGRDGGNRQHPSNGLPSWRRGTNPRLERLSCYHGRWLSGPRRSSRFYPTLQVPGPSRDKIPTWPIDRSSSSLATLSAHRGPLTIFFVRADQRGIELRITICRHCERPFQCQNWGFSRGLNNHEENFSDPVTVRGPKGVSKQTNLRRNQVCACCC
ncbi:hypothetical protein N657DRAFT_99963 [Parathielavia appendiculata]|uniref:Uncharacterized protein n=1 Tax=Parathielavia appendiculata TaxID=2587402 RepID=A0AAN6TW64_9PEZI|nr:hypothetical protein N657DRAFT_99963 [Parathielavia appendiculata]